ncbi:MAG: fibronectin type III domain-containing protein [Eubacterium sp.]
MKKVISLLLSLVMFITMTVGAFSAEAAVCYDKDNPDVSTSTHLMLNISGNDYYKAAFDVLARLNTVRTADGESTLPMDSEMLEAAMLRAREISTYVNVEYRPNGERFDYIVDGTGSVIAYTLAVDSNYLGASDIADYWTSNSNNKSVIASPDLKSAGVGCFLDPYGTYFWALFLSEDAPTKVVKASDYSATVNRTVKIALRKDLTAYWDAVHKHTYKSVVSAKANASSKKNGTITKTCSVCSKKTTSTIYYPKTVTLSATSYTYDGKVKKPTVKVKDSKGNTIGSQYYTVSYSSGRKNVGQYTVTIKFKGNYTGTIKKTFTIKPKNTSISKVTAGKKKFTVKWKKQATQTTGYQIQYSTSSKFSNAKTVTVSKNKTTSKTISKLKAKKKYYVRIRTYKTVKVNGKSTKIYSSWSKTKSVTTKK